MSLQALRILLLEDSESDADLLTLELKRAGFAPETTRVESREAFSEALERGPWDLLVADYNLPSFNGLDALSIYKQSGLDVPFFLVSGTVGEEVAVTAMRTGAHDYLLKDNLTRLGPAVARELREANLRRARRDDLERFRLLEEQLRQAQKLDALGTLAGGIAHDFNNILSAISAYTELARLDAERPDAVREHLNEVINATSRATELVRRILAFSRQHKQARVPVQLERVITDALKLVRSTLPTTIEIVSTIHGGAPTVLADPIQVHQVLMNLCTNAAHAMADRTGRLAVELRAIELDATFTEAHRELRVGRYVRLSVMDSGCGMDGATVARIFEPFFTTKLPGEGTGLGLAVVHGIVRDHDGAILVRSERGKGTTFEVYFPESSLKLPPKLDSEREPPRGHGERVLFVDDEPALCRSASSMLSRLGYHVTTTSDPEQALQRFREAPDAIDVVVTDLTMPRMTGVDLSRELLLLRPELPIVLLSGFSGKWTPEKAREIGIRASLGKPVSLSRLAGVLRQVLDGAARPGPRARSE